MAANTRGGSTYGSSIFVNINLEHKDGQTGEPERTVPVKTKTIHETEGWDWNRGTYGDGKVMLRRGGEETKELLPLKSSKEFFFHYSCFLLPGSLIPHDPLIPSQHSMYLHQAALKNIWCTVPYKNYTYFFSPSRKFYIVIIGNGHAEALVYGDSICKELSQLDVSERLYFG